MYLAQLHATSKPQRLRLDFAGPTPGQSGSARVPPNQRAEGRNGMKWDEMGRFPIQKQNVAKDRTADGESWNLRRDSEIHKNTSLKVKGLQLGIVKTCHRNQKQTQQNIGMIWGLTNGISGSLSFELFPGSFFWSRLSEVDVTWCDLKRLWQVIPD